MNITLYSTHCPKCAIVEKKLNMAKVNYTICDDVEVMKNRGFMSAPIVEVDDKIYKFKEAIDWANSIIKGEAVANAN